MIDFNILKTAMGDLDDDTVMAMVKEALSGGMEDVKRAVQACHEGINIVGDKFSSGEYFVADLIFSGDLMNNAMALLKPVFAGSGTKSIGKIILCTVEGDIHDIGKNIVKSLMEGAGIEVVDLGIDVAPAVIVETAKKEKIKVIALSGVLTLAINSMKATVEAFSKAGMRDNVKILMGGAPVSNEYCKVVGADAWTQAAHEGVNICRNWLTA